MVVLTIRQFGDPVLKEKCMPVEKVDKEIEELIKNLADTMHAAPGIGLAAPQLGILRQVLILDLEEGKGLVAYINPKIVSASSNLVEDEEGCLSVPEVKVAIKRPEKIVVQALNSRGKKVKFEADNLLARAIQHEIDHLNGILILDRVSGKERREALLKLSGVLPTHSDKKDPTIL